MPAKKQHVELICDECWKLFTVEPYRANRAKYCCWICGQKAKARNSAEIRGSKQRGRGEGKSYIKLNGRHMHRVVAEQKLGRALLPGEIVHHIDGNRRNNLPENLEVMFQPEHMRLHVPMMLEKKRLLKIEPAPVST